MKQVPCLENGTSQQFLETINLLLLPTLFKSFYFQFFFLKILERFFSEHLSLNRKLFLYKKQKKKKCSFIFRELKHKKANNFTNKYPQLTFEISSTMFFLKIKNSIHSIFKNKALFPVEFFLQLTRHHKII